MFVETISKTNTAFCQVATIKCCYACRRLEGGKKPGFIGQNKPLVCLSVCPSSSHYILCKQKYYPNNKYFTCCCRCFSCLTRVAVVVAVAVVRSLCTLIGFRSFLVWHSMLICISDECCCSCRFYWCWSGIYIHLLVLLLCCCLYWLNLFAPTLNAAVGRCAWVSLPLRCNNDNNDNNNGNDISSNNN